MRVYSVVYGHTRFLGIQAGLWKKFCPYMTEFVVVNNGPDHAAIERSARWLGLRTIRCPNIPHLRPSRSHSLAIDHAIRTEAADAPGMFFVDFDLFPLRKFAAITGSIAGCQARSDAGLHYPWGGALYLGEDLPARAAITVDDGTYYGAPCDTGGGVLPYLKQHPNIVMEWWPPLRNLRADELPAQIYVSPLVRPFLSIVAGGFQIARECCLHFTSGTNWRNHSPDIAREKEAYLFKLLEYYESL